MPDDSLPTFSVIVPTFQRLDVLPLNLRALLATEYPADRFEVLVVDDARSPDTAAVIEAMRVDGRQLRLVEGPGRGAAAARNCGADRAAGRFLVFVDDDILVPPDHLRAQLETRAVHGDCIVGADWTFTAEVAAELSTSSLGRYRLAVEEAIRKPFTQRWSSPSGLATSHMTVERTVFEQVGRFEEIFPRAGVEDWEFCLRARELGIKLILDHELRLLHHDRRLTLTQLCNREEWRGVSVGILTRLRPEGYADADVVRENTPIRPGDPLRLRLRKAIKETLGIPILLAVVHRATDLLARLMNYDPLLHRLFTAVISVHYLRGFRSGLRVASEPRARDTVA